MSEIQDIVQRFLNEHFCVEDGIFACKDENNILGNNRYNFAHYLIGNVEVAMLVGENPRYVEQAAQVEMLSKENPIVNLCFMEIFAPMFRISTIVGLTPVERRSVVSPSIMIRESYVFDFKMFKIDGDPRKARAYFTFAKLTK